MQVECIFIVRMRDNSKQTQLRERVFGALVYIYSHWRGHLLSLNYRKKYVDIIFAKTLPAVDFCLRI